MKTPQDWPGDNPASALKHFYNSNYPWLEKYILQNSGTVEDAKDIFQESLIAAWINFKEGRFSGSEENFNAYLRQICKFKWITHLRSAEHKKMHYIDDLAALDRPSDSTAINKEQLLEGQLLKSSFEQLGEKCRELLGLFYYRRKSLAEIALLQNTTEDSTKTLKYRCMLQLRKIYLNKHEGNGEV